MPLMKRIVMIVGGLTLIALAVFVGWSFGRNDTAGNNDDGQSQSKSAQSEADQTGGTAPELQSLVSFTVPDGWRQEGCAGRPASLYFIPPGQNLDCAADPSALVSLTVDPQNTTSCQQLDGQQQVSRHVCRSQDINGRRSLEAETDYLQSSRFGRETTIKRYFIDTGDKVVEARYQFSGADSAGDGFERLAKSITAK